MRRFLLVSTVCAMMAGAVLALAPVTDDVRDIYSRSAQIVSKQLPRAHLTGKAFNDDIATNAFHLFITALDYDRSFFLAEDVDALLKQAPHLEDRVKDGDLEFAFEVYDLYLTRVSNRVEYVNELLENGFDLNLQETYNWKRKDAPWPASEEEWDDLWRKKIKNQYLARVVSERLKEEAKDDEDQADSEAEETQEVAEESTPEEEIRKQYQRYLSVLEDNDAHWLLQLYITSFAQAYDPHSDYLSANNEEDFNISMSLSLVGIGALLSREDGAAKVVRLIPGGPAEKDGRLQAGDKIIAVGQGDDKPIDIMHWPLSKSVRMIRGEKGTKVVLVVIPASDISGTSVSRIDLIRDEVKLEERAAKSELHETKDALNAIRKLGVIKIPDFYSDISGRKNGEEDARSVTRDVAVLIDNLKTNDIEGLVLDLRGNSGGALNEAVDLSGLFIGRGPIVQVRSGRGIQVLRDTDAGVAYGGPLIVLVNRHSASASEILAGALKDYGRALVVGDTTTHGKGTVQSLINVDPRDKTLGSLKFTTACFYRIAGDSTQRKGVPSDIVIPSLLDYMEVGESFIPNALPESSVDPLRYTKVSNLEMFLPFLEERSSARRDADGRYGAYVSLLEELGAQREAENISLSLDDRLEMARHERKLAEFIDESDEDDEAGEKAKEEDEEKKKSADLVLEESLNILADIVLLKEVGLRKNAVP